MYTIPILILTHNRPRHLHMLVSQLKKIKPSKIYVACDGPKDDLDRSQIKKIHQVLNLFSKDTKIFKKFYKKNKGIKLGPQSGISWFFKNDTHFFIFKKPRYPRLWP